MSWDELAQMAKEMSAKEAQLSPEERDRLLRKQKVSWVYGNCKLSNPDITMEMVEEAYDRMYPQEPRQEVDWEEAKLHKT